MVTATTLLLATLMASAQSPAQSGSLSSAASALEEVLDHTESWLKEESLILEQDRQSTLLTLPAAERGTASSAAAAETGTLVITVGGNTVELHDVPRSAWFAPFVRRAADEGIVSGYRDAAGMPTGLFGPGDSVTVAELAKLAVGAAGIQQSACLPSQNPAAAGAWFAAVMGCAEQQGWILYSDKTVNPLRPALRGEVVVTMMQALRVTLSSVAGAGPFDDVTASTQYAPAIARAKRDSIVRGYTDASGAPTGLFGPTDNVTRAEAAKIVLLAKDAYTR